MVKLWLFSLVLFTAACAEQYKEPIQFSPHGAAVRNNVMVHAIDPHPKGTHLPPSDAARAAIGVDAYRAGEVKDPLDSASSPDTISIDGVN